MLRQEQRSPVDLKGMWYANHEKIRHALRSNNDVSVGALCPSCSDWHSNSPGVLEVAAFCSPLASALDRLSGRHLLGDEYHLGVSLENTNQPGVSLYHCPHFSADARSCPIVGRCALFGLGRDPGHV